MGYPIICKAAMTCAIAAALVASIAACGSDNSSSSSSSTSASASSSAMSGNSDVKAITTAYTEFFDGATPDDKKMQVLEDGQQFAAVMKAQGSMPMATQTQATVADVKVTDPSHATLTYSITMKGNALLPNQPGTAVKQGGAWKVSKKSFCGLLKLEGSVPPACNGVS